MCRRRGTILLIAVALLGAAPLSSRADDDERPAVEERHDGDRIVVEGSFDVPAPAQVAWKVLSDYDHLSKFVSSMRHSLVRERRESAVIVEQEAVASVLFFRREVRLLLAIQEEPTRLIAFRDTAGRDFALYEGSWTLAEDGGRTKVVYHLEAKPRTGVPALIGAPVFRASAADLLAQVRREIVRRSAQELPPAPSP